jgi:hypothetical protein
MTVGVVVVLVWFTVLFSAVVVILVTSRPPARRRYVDADSPASNARAEKLLLRCLTPAQARQYQREQRFFVRSQFGRLYCVDRARVKNVHSDTGAYCLTTRTPLPLADVMLIQKFMLELDERRFLAEAR